MNLGPEPLEPLDVGRIAALAYGLPVREPVRPMVPDPAPTQWCVGCDKLVEGDLMAWTAAGEWLCEACRSWGAAAPV